MKKSFIGRLYKCDKFQFIISISTFPRCSLIQGYLSIHHMLPQLPRGRDVTNQPCSAHNTILYWKNTYSTLGENFQHLLAIKYGIRLILFWFAYWYKFYVIFCLFMATFPHLFAESKHKTFRSKSQSYNSLYSITCYINLIIHLFLTPFLI